MSMNPNRKSCGCLKDTHCAHGGPDMPEFEVDLLDEPDLAALFDGAPPEPAPKKETGGGKVLRWKKALYPEAIKAVEIARAAHAKSRSKKVAQLILRTAKKQWPGWAKKNKYRVTLWIAMLREVIGITPAPSLPIPLLEEQDLDADTGGDDLV